MLVCLAFVGSQLPSLGQTPLNDLIFTVGTTARDVSSHDWSYVLLGSPQPELLSGKRFAIYSKAGFSTNAGTFVLRGAVFQQGDSGAINTLLNQSVALGEDLLSLSNTLNTLLRNIPGAINQTLAQKVATGFQAAAGDPVLAATLGLAIRTHPGLAQCAGQAFSEQISAVTTYEVREVNPNTGTAGDVIGRVTIVPGTPVILPAPGQPYQLVTKEPAEHLRIRLRWGTPDPLRRLSLLSFGFNLWRIPQAAAESAGYNVTPPTLAQLYSDANFTRANNGPVSTSKDFLGGTGAGAADDPADATTYFFSDDNGARYGLPPFADGAQYYYFVTARDILGRDGLVSAGRLSQACRRLPPQTATQVHVLNNLQTTDLGGGLVTNQQRLLVTWQQNTNAADLVSEYWVYRWPNPTMAMTNDASPSSNRVGIVAQAPNTNVNSFLDTSIGAPTDAGPGSYWYTVRAISQAACGPLLSPHSGPAWGVLRQRAGPDAPSGVVYGSCGTPVVMFQNFNTLANDPDTVNWNYQFTCQRRDPGIAWVQFFITNRTTSGTSWDSLAPIYFAPGDNIVQAQYSQRIFSYSTPTNDIGCVVGTYYGAMSAPGVAHFTVPVPNTQRAEAVFLAGQLLETALSVTDPLVTALNGFGPFCLSASSATPDASGTVALTFAVTPGTPMAIQVLETNVWTDLGVVLPDSNFVYWVSYPACIVGPMQSFRGCVVNLPAGSTACLEHITRAADDGPVAPVQVQITPTPRTKEYRLYRSIDDGPLTLISQGAAVFARRVVRTDDAMPPSAARACYFAQVLDENGNGSPMSFLGCRDLKPSTVPLPVLAEPQAIGTPANPQVALSWFCPTAGVYRFQFKIQRVDQPNSGQPTGFGGSRFSLMANYNPAALYKGLFSRRFRLGARSALAQFDEAQFTPPVGPGFGPGPQFTINADVVPNARYNICVASVDAQGTVLDNSQIWSFTWTPPVVLASVPWPARPLPPVSSFDDLPSFIIGGGSDVGASLIFSYGVNGLQLDQRSPVGIALGGFSLLYSHNYQLSLNAGTTGFLSYTTLDTDQALDPNKFVTTRSSGDPTRRGQPLLPIVVYRQQVTNVNFPKVSGHLTQVTPMLERIPYSVTSIPGHSATVTINDRLIAGGVIPVGDIFLSTLFLRDQQPVIKGASYQYFIAHFDDKREVDQVIPAGGVDIPTN